MTTKKELALLEKVFVAEINGEIFQTKSKLTKKLVEDGMLEFIERKDMTPIGYMTVSYYQLTYLGRLTYCLTCDGETDGEDI